MFPQERNPAQNKSVLIPAGPGPKGYWCVRSLASAGITTIVAADDRFSPASGSRYCDEFVTIPSPWVDLIEYKDALLELASRNAVETVVPIRSQDTYVLSKYFDEFDEVVSPIVPKLETLKTVHDRVSLFDAAEQIGVPMPKTRRLEEMDAWDSNAIVKSRYNILADEYHASCRPGDFEVVKSVEHFGPGQKPDRDAIHAQMKHDPIVQEYIDSSAPYVFGALYDHGEAVATFQHKQIRGNSYTGGGGVYRKSVDVPELEAVGTKLLDGIDWHGLACIEYLRDAATGEFKLIEINPRMWQSLPCAVRSGADFPLYYWLLATGQVDRIDPSYEVGVGSHWLYGELRYIYNLLSDESTLVDPPPFLAECRSILDSFIEMPYLDDFCLDDPYPFVKGMAFALENKRPRLRAEEEIDVVSETVPTS